MSSDVFGALSFTSSTFLSSLEEDALEGSEFVASFGSGCVFLSSLFADDWCSSAFFSLSVIYHSFANGPFDFFECVIGVSDLLAKGNDFCLNGECLSTS